MGALAFPYRVLMARIPRGRLTRMVATVAVGTIIVGGASLIPGSTTTPTSPSGVDIWVATNGNDSTCVRGNQSFPCLTLDRARDIAQCGDEVEIIDGTYADQDLAGPTSSCTSNPVVMRSYSASGHGASFNRIDMDSPGTTLDNIWIRNDLARQCTDAGGTLNCPDGGGDSGVTYQIFFWSACNTCSLVNSEVRSLQISSSDNVLIDNNIFDANPCPNQSCNGTDKSMELSPFPAGDPQTNITFSNNEIRDFWPTPNAPCCNHGEGIRIGGMTNGLTIEGNYYEGNGDTGHMFLTWFGTGCTAYSVACSPKNICIRDNTFGPRHGSTFLDVDARSEITADVISQNLNIKIDPAQNAAIANSVYEQPC